MKEKFFANKFCMLFFPLFVLALFSYSIYSYYYVYVRWSNIPEIILYSVLTVVTTAVMGWFAVETDKSKNRTAGKKLLCTAAVIAVSIAVLFGVTYLINNVWGKAGEAKFAISVSLTLMMLINIVLSIIFFSNRSKSGLKILNRVLAAVIAIAMACASLNIIHGFFTYHWTYPIYRMFNDIGGTATDNASVVYDFAYSTEKPLQTDNLGSDTEMGISLAKNELEGLQILFAANKKGVGISLEVTDFTNSAGEKLPVTVYREVYTAVREYGDTFSNKYADALVPVTAADTLSLEKNKAQAFYIETRSSADSAAGEYTAVLTAKDSSGNVILTKSITATVWNFTLPQKPASDTAMGLASAKFWELNGFDASSYGWNGVGGADITDEQSEMYLRYYNYLLDHKISPYTLPYDILDDRADAFMSDERVTSFCIPYPSDDAKLIQYYEKVTSNPVWAAKGYFYPIDEPGNSEAYAEYTEMTERLARLCPGYNMVTPFCTQKVTIDGQEYSAVELQEGKSSILCAISDMYDKDGFYPEMTSAAESGSRIWWYVCCGPQGDYNNFFIRHDAIQHRLLFWQQKSLNITGLLYWSTTYWDKANPWESSKTWDSYDAAGDGCLLYPGPSVGIDGPVGTIRIANITDGIEDYDYLTLAEKQFGREWIDAKISEVTSSLTEYTGDDALLESVRSSIGEALARAEVS